MGKKPMYLKRKTSSKMVVLFLCLIVFVVLHLIVGSEKPTDEPVVIEQKAIPTSEFKGKAQKIIAPKSQIEAYFMHQKSNLTAISFIFEEAGYAYDPQNKEGLAQIAAATLKEGAGWWSAKELRNLTGSKGIKIGFAAQRDDFAGSITFPKQAQEEAIKFLREMFKNPHFEDKYVDNAKNSNIKLLEVEKEDPQTQLALEMESKIYGDFVYARNPLGKIEDIRGISRRDLLNFVKNYLGKNKIYVGITGDLSVAEAQELIDDLFANLPIVADKDIGRPQINWMQPTLQISRKQEQDIVMYAAPGTCRLCDDFYPLYIANYLFGGAGLNSRANQLLREEKGLTYGVYSQLDINDKANLLTAAFSSAADKTALAKDLFIKEWQRTGKEGFSEEELRQAKDYLTASFNLRFASTAGIADMLAYMQKYGLGIDFLQKRNRLVEEVSLQQVNAAAAKYFTNQLLQAEIGNF